MNGPVDSRTGEFVYMAIPEGSPVHPDMERPYADLQPVLERMGRSLPGHLAHRHMHLDPDFQHLTYGDQGQRARQLAGLDPGDCLAFYASLIDVTGQAGLAYSLIGLLVVERIVLAADLSPQNRDINAHSRRRLEPGSKDLVVLGRAGSSGRLRRCLLIGEYRDRAYRVTKELLAEWGGLSVRDGYLQRSARLPRFLEPLRFLSWLERQRPELMQANN